MSNGMDGDFIAFHAVFALLSWLGTHSGHGLPFGQVAFALAVIYNTGFALWLGPRHDTLRKLWRFVFPLSVMLMYPDWILAQQFGVRRFKNDGFPALGGTVPLYMAGLWAVPLAIVIFAGLQVRRRGHDGTKL